MSNIVFSNTEHQIFYTENIKSCKINDCFHRAFLYIMGLAPETRKNIRRLFDFKNDCVIPKGLQEEWQTDSSEKICRLAFNLWNGYIDKECPKNSTPEKLFCCSYAPYFQEGIKLRYPEYMRTVTCSISKVTYYHEDEVSAPSF